MDKIAKKSGIKGVKVVQMLVFSSKGVENGKFWRQYDATSKKRLMLVLKKASDKFLDIFTWSKGIKLP